MVNIFQSTYQATASGQTITLCIVISTSGSVPRRAGAKMLVWPDGRIEGTIGGGGTELEVIKRALQLKPGDTPQIHSFDLKPEHGLACGGSIEVYMELLFPSERLFIFGAGHIGKALAGMALRFGFAVTMVDDRAEIFTEADRSAYHCIMASYPEVPASLGINATDFVVVTTYEHKLDIEITAVAARTCPLYIGLIGSKGKLALARKRFTEDFGLTDELINRIDMPIGVAIAAETPDEIALAILASLIDARNRSHGLKSKK
ncbi:MAG TPA: xanthine dehydrogenase [Bacteroidales bacterium]|nr:MAG: hypothetical protein A2X11_07770 [Bacteroidetes bacterium GWE2_42_24]OFY26466.1 MAG: hypothetical protein A2X09_02185 [Bacteroidetes bacterium GWF2_43_11]HAQ65454.1 xanthine dehydrogenase [Bacteroidales bacterium]HBZ68132.1 xanthine dehydrogenase [Bacteroidales bacterium]